MTASLWRHRLVGDVRSWTAQGLGGNVAAGGPGLRDVGLFLLDTDWVSLSFWLTQDLVTQSKSK